MEVHVDLKNAFSGRIGNRRITFGYNLWFPSHPTMQPRLFEEWIEKGHQRDVNLCGACARPADERSLVRGGGGYNQGSCVYFAKGCGGCVFIGVNGVS